MYSLFTYHTHTSSHSLVASCPHPMDRARCAAYVLWLWNKSFPCYVLRGLLGNSSMSIWYIGGAIQHSQLVCSSAPVLHSRPASSWKWWEAGWLHETTSALGNSPNYCEPPLLCHMHTHVVPVVLNIPLFTCHLRTYICTHNMSFVAVWQVYVVHKVRMVRRRVSAQRHLPELRGIIDLISTCM